MENRTIKPGWHATGIVGMIFVPMGLIYSLLGVLLWYFKVGDEPKEPLIFLCVFGGIGALFLLVGLGLLWADIRRRKAVRRAAELGTMVMADVSAIQQVTSVTNHKGGHPWVVECRCQDPDTGVVHVLHSRYLNFNPTGLLEGKQVPVYVDRDGGKHGFYVDIDAVLPQVEVHD